jgi:Amt family ammonium transporter
VTENLNQWYAAGDQAYILVASAMVLVMIPGLAFLYSGLARRKSALSMIWACMFSASVITFQWYFWGYSLAFGPSTNGFIGNLDKFGLKGVLAAPSPGSPLIPELLYSFYQVRSTRTCSQHILTHSRCNSALSLLPLSSVALLNVVA